MKNSAIAAVAAFAAFALVASAQTQPAPGGGGGRRFNFDPEAMRQQILARYKDALAPTDEEWKVIEPKLAKISLLRLDVTVLPGMMNRGMGPNRINFRSIIRTILDPNALPSQVEEKSRELQELIDNNETSTDAYSNKLAQLRKARQRAIDDLAAAQKELTSILTVRQEAALVQLGLLD